jgi:hypothetical protein
MRIAAFALFALAASVAFVQPLAAGPITYVESGEISGTLGSTALDNVAFTFTFVGDTANITTSSGVFYNIATSNAVTIGSTNTTFTSSVEVGLNNLNGFIGLCDVISGCGPQITFEGAPGSSTYALATSISIPQSGATDLIGSFTTAAGTLTATSAQDLLFTATLGTATPEPGTVGMLGAGLAALAFLRKRIR